MRSGELDQFLGYLGRQFPRRDEDQAAGTAGPAVADQRNEGDSEGDGLARAGRRSAADVSAVERQRQGDRLDGERLGDASLRQAIRDGTRHSEIGEC